MKYVRVPVEPTEEMILAAKVAICSSGFISEVWEAFIEEAPQDDTWDIVKEQFDIAVDQCSWQGYHEWFIMESFIDPQVKQLRDWGLNNGLLERNKDNPYLVRVKDEV